MKEHIKRFLFGGDSFKKDFIHQIKYLVILTLAFTIAFSWRETVFNATKSFIQSVISVQSLNLLSVLTSLTVTIFSVIIIWIMIKSLEE
ncbi:MAG: hypothetical protein Q7R87_02565 [Nanoarchaeota archaeon]|nr:hypothetical protein [Nanoarchaeota archaeon]